MGQVDLVDVTRMREDARRALDGRHVALIVAFAIGATYIAGKPRPGSETVSTGGQIVLNVIAFLPLVLAWRWPTVAAAATTLTTIIVLRAQEAPLAVASFAVTVLLLTYLVTRRGLPYAVPLGVPFLALAMRRLDGPNSALASTAPLLFLIAALVVGESMRRRGVAVAALGATKEAMAESEKARTVMEERARIARELHDIVAHHLSVIAVQSETARLTSAGLASDTSEQLEAIAGTAREALTETRRLLGVLREDTGAKAERAPQPGLAELDALIEKARDTGMPIYLEQRGTAARLPLSVDLAAYRIVQEALTNARRHAPGAQVEIELAYDDQALHLRIRDRGPGAPDGTPVEGHGLMGMRERAALAGGTFWSGPAAGGGFQVDVTLPFTEVAQ